MAAYEQTTGQPIPGKREIARGIESKVGELVASSDPEAANQLNWFEETLGDVLSEMDPGEEEDGEVSQEKYDEAQENAATAWQHAEAVAARVAREPADTWEDAQNQAERMSVAWAEAAAACKKAGEVVARFESGM